MKIIVISPNKVLREEVLLSIKGIDASGHDLVFGDGFSHLGQMVDTERPDLMIIDSVCVENGNLSILEGISLRFHQISIILLSQNASSEFLMSAMRSGVKDVLSLPLQANDLQAAVGRVELKLKQSSQKK